MRRRRDIRRMRKAKGFHSPKFMMKYSSLSRAAVELEV
jgi:hypothetical protein